MPRALANNNRASGGASGGRIRAYVADPSCPCCDDDCPLWTRIVQCSPGPSCDGTPPPTPVEAWICATVRCIDGRPLAAGMVFLLDGTCWTVQIEQQQTPPPGALIVSGLDPVECVENCYDPRCPQGAQFLVSRPCNVGAPSYYVCGITECGVYDLPPPATGCHVVDPASGYIPGSALPPGAITINGSGLPRRNSCCDCSTYEGCGGSAVDIVLRNPLGECQTEPPCYENRNTCCCETDPETGQFLGRIRILEATQVRNDLIVPGGGIPGSFTGILGAETIDPATGYATYRRFIRRDGYGQPTETSEIAPQSFPYGVCGWRGSEFSQEGQNNTLLHAFFDGSLGRARCSDCPQVGIVDTQLSLSSDCSHLTLTCSYRSVGPDHLTTFTITLRAEIVNIQTCGGDCAGRAVSAPRQPVSGCSGCGAGNKMTPIK